MLKKTLSAFVFATMMAATFLPFTALSASKDAASPKAASWDGTWSGISSSGGRTTVKIANGKVTYWTNNGYSRPKATGSAKGSSVVLDDNNGWKATMTLQGEGKARITAAGIGNNGQPAKNSAVLIKQ